MQAMIHPKRKLIAAGHWAHESAVKICKKIKSNKILLYVWHHLEFPNHCSELDIFLKTNHCTRLIFTHKSPMFAVSFITKYTIIDCTCQYICIIRWHIDRNMQIQIQRSTSIVTAFKQHTIFIYVKHYTSHEIGKHHTQLVFMWRIIHWGLVPPFWRQ